MAALFFVLIVIGAVALAIILAAHYVESRDAQAFYSTACERAGAYGTLVFLAAWVSACAVGIVWVIRAF